jgi:hypothetical protein
MTTDNLWSLAIGVALIASAVILLADMDKEKQSLSRYMFSVFLVSMKLTIAILLILSGVSE